MAYLLDTNILLRLFDKKSPAHSTVQAAVDRLKAQGKALHFAPQNAAEFWNVATRPLDKNGLGLTPAEADPLLSEVERLFTLLPETPALYPAWRLLVRSVGVSGVQVHDARLVAWMQAHRLTHVLTLNPDDFTRFATQTGIVVVNPNNLIASTGSR